MLSEEEKVLRRLRRRYSRNGLRIWKVREDSRWYAEFGPYSLVDVFLNAVVARSLSFEELVEGYEP